MALDADGKFLALDIDGLATIGAYLTSHGAFIATVNFARCLPCMYDIRQLGLRIRCLFTNTVPTGPYRGAGRPEANYCLERLVDEAARVIGIDRIELRRRNLIAPARCPIKTRGRHHLSTAAISRRCSTPRWRRADVAGLCRAPRPLEAAGKRRGLGVSCFLEIAGGQPGEGAAVDFPGGSRLLLAIGVQPSGQGHRTLYRRLVAEQLGIPVEQVELADGDSDDEVPSAGAVASRSTMSVGGAVAATLTRSSKRAAGSRRMCSKRPRPTSPTDDGVFEIAGTDRRIVAVRARRTGAISPGRVIAESLDTETHCRRAARPFPTASMSPRSRSILRPAVPLWPPILRSTIAAACCNRCWSRARSRAGSPRGSARRCSKPAFTT